MDDPMKETTLSTRRVFEGRALTVEVLDIAMPVGAPISKGRGAYALGMCRRLY